MCMLLDNYLAGKVNTVRIEMLDPFGPIKQDY